MIICKFCGVKNEVITACFLGDNKKWTIYRANFDEVTFEIKYGLVVNMSKELTPMEMFHVQKNIIGKSYIFLSEKIISYGSRGLSDLTISKILSISVYTVKGIMIKYWDDKIKTKTI